VAVSTGTQEARTDDDALVRACRAGDQAAWAALVGRYERLIYSIPRRSGLGPEATAEVFQQVFTILAEQIGQIEHTDRLAAWLVTTARRETWRVSQREGRARPFRPSQEGEESEEGKLPEDGPLPDEVVLLLEQRHAVRTALATLGEPCRQLLELLFYRADPPPYAEIAATLGVSTGSIGPTRARCLHKLRRYLDELGFG